MVCYNHQSFLERVECKGVYILQLGGGGGGGKNHSPTPPPTPPPV